MINDNNAANGVREYSHDSSVSKESDPSCETKFRGMITEDVLASSSASSASSVTDNPDNTPVQPSYHSFPAMDDEYVEFEESDSPSLDFFRGIIWCILFLLIMIAVGIPLYFLLKLFSGFSF